MAADPLFTEIAILYDRVKDVREDMDHALLYIDHASHTHEMCRERVNDVQQKVDDVMETVDAIVNIMDSAEELDPLLKNRMDEIMGHIDGLRDVTENAAYETNKASMRNTLMEARHIAQDIENRLSAVMHMIGLHESNESFGGRRRTRSHSKTSKRGKRMQRKTQRKRMQRKTQHNTHRKRTHRK